MISGARRKTAALPVGVLYEPLGGKHSAAHVAELEMARTRAEHDLVSVLEERSFAPVRELQRHGAVTRELDQGALRARVGAGDRAGRHQVAGASRGAVRG